MDMVNVLAFWAPNAAELIIVLVIGLLLFGKRLPEVARSLGKGVVEFKRGVKGIEDDVNYAEEQRPEAPNAGEHPSPYSRDRPR